MVSSLALRMVVYVPSEAVVVTRLGLEPMALALKA